jgi:hypothetical protein
MDKVDHDKVVSAGGLGNGRTGFPPAGWVTNHEAGRMLGVGLNTLTCVAWKWRPWL